jgi:ketosteroid isomerase-like protein
MASEFESRLARLEGRAAIVELVTEYGSRIDAHDLPGLLDLFTSDARFNDYAGREGLTELFTNVFATMERSVHTAHNPVIVFDSDTEAHGTVVGHAEQTGEGTVLVMALRYRDVYRRDEDRWRIAERRTGYFYRLKAEEYVARFGSARPYFRAGEYRPADA